MDDKIVFVGTIVFINRNCYVAEQCDCPDPGTGADSCSCEDF